MKECIGIIAGTGQYPFMAAHGAREKGYKVVACGFWGYSDPLLQHSVDVFQMLQLGQLNKMIKFFHKEGVTKVCMAGAINKSRALAFKPDLRALRLFFSLPNKGDDVLLRAIIQELEQEGFSIISASDFVPSLFSPPGILSKKEPNEVIWKAISYGWPIAETIGNLDIGQLIVVKEGIVVAVECMDGTDATLKRSSELGGKGCVAIKVAKLHQDERVDLPSVGLETIQKLIEYDFSCLAIHAEKTLFFNLSESLTLADKHNLCIVALTPEDLSKKFYC